MSAAAGGAFLDQVLPQWARITDPATLDMGSPASCVLAQVCTDDVLDAYRAAMAHARLPVTAGDYARYAAMAWHLSGLPDTTRATWSRRHGFLPGIIDTAPDLTENWKTQIHSRRRAGAK